MTAPINTEDAELVERFQAERSEYFSPPICDILREYETWRTASGITRVEEENVRLRELLGIGEKFLNACVSAWSCGEPSHRVKTMLDSADEFRAALAQDR